MPGFDAGQVAEALLAARSRGVLVTPPSTLHPDFDLQAGYATGAELVRLRRAAGARTVGRKIGFTNRDTWAAFGVDTPIWAHVYDDTLTLWAGNSASVGIAGMALPRIEPEIVFKLKSAPPAGTWDPVALLAAAEWVALGFEIVDCHYPDWRFKPADTLADFGLHAALVVGEPRPVRPDQLEHLAAALSDARVSLLRDGQQVAEGRGRNALGNPALALAYLADRLSRQPWAEPLQPAEVITTGTLTPVLPIAPGEEWAFEAQGLGLPRLTLTITRTH